MKRVLFLLSIVALTTFGCKKTETKTAGNAVMKPASSAAAKPAGNAEKMLVGKWSNPAVKGFLAEFNSDHKGVTTTADPSGKAAPAQIPFKWALESDGKLKITEGKKTIPGKLINNKLEIDFEGAKTVLEKAK